MGTLAHLTVEIKGTTYGVEILSGDQTVNGCKVARLSKGDGATYDVEQGFDRTTCTCPDWQRRHAGLPHSEGCKHIRAMVECGLIENVKPWVADEADMPAEQGVSGAYYAAGEIAAEVARDHAAQAKPAKLVADPVEVVPVVQVRPPAGDANTVAGLWMAAVELMDEQAEGTHASRETVITTTTPTTTPAVAVRAPRRGRGRPVVTVDGTDWAAYGERYAAGEGYRALAQEAGYKPSTFLNRLNAAGYGKSGKKVVVVA